MEFEWSREDRFPGYVTGIDRELVKKVVKIRKAHKEWICTRHDACPCDGSDCIYPCTCMMKRKKLQ